jgi:hypothetical protein
MSALMGNNDISTDGQAGNDPGLGRKPVKWAKLLPYCTLPVPPEIGPRQDGEMENGAVNHASEPVNHAVSYKATQNFARGTMSPTWPQLSWSKWVPVSSWP